MADIISIESLYKIVSSNDKMTFGQYKGYEVGLVYLYDPSYLEWALLNTKLAISNIEYLQRLKVIVNLSIRDSYMMWQTIGKKEFLEEYHKYFSFDDIKFCGTEKFEFSSLALQKNAERVGVSKKYTETPIVDESAIIYYCAGINVDTNEQDLFSKLLFMCKGHNYTTKGMKYYILEFDNRNGIFLKLPRIVDCKIGLKFANEFSFKTGLKYKIVRQNKNISFENV